MKIHKTPIQIWLTITLIRLKIQISKLELTRRNPRWSRALCTKDRISKQETSRQSTHRDHQWWWLLNLLGLKTKEQSRRHLTSHNLVTTLKTLKNRAHRSNLRTERSRGATCFKASMINLNKATTIACLLTQWICKQNLIKTIKLRNKVTNSRRASRSSLTCPTSKTRTITTSSQTSSKVSFNHFTYYYNIFILNLKKPWKTNLKWNTRTPQAKSQSKQACASQP